MATMEKEAQTTAPVSATVVTASEVARRYGEGDTAVDALRGVSLEVARGDDGLRSAFGDVDRRHCERFTHQGPFLEEIRYEKDKTIVCFLTKRA